MLFHKICNHYRWYKNIAVSVFRPASIQIIYNFIVFDLQDKEIS